MPSQQRYIIYAVEVWRQNIEISSQTIEVAIGQHLQVRKSFAPSTMVPDIDTM